tara:strand:- start:6088 stop:6915 length:828 start_codon:yes stop_codon:yes gene_type:complete
MSYETLKKHRTFEGETLFCEHDSTATKTKMKFSVYMPNAKVDSAIIWLSGLTCTDENFITKAGAQKILAGTNTMIICPDTSPRGVGAPGEDESYDFGTGAGFYVNATTDGYKDNYQMYDYIVKDLVSVLKDDFNVQKISITGHSMGGHGALVIGLREKEIFASVSAFSPIVNPVQCPWGQKALKGYLGDNESEWKEYDACELIKAGKRASSSLLVDQGLADEFLKEQLLSDNLKKVCSETDQALELNFREGYDHSYYFISTFIEDHIKFHLKHLA